MAGIDNERLAANAHFSRLTCSKWANFSSSSKLPVLKTHACFTQKIFLLLSSLQLFLISIFLYNQKVYVKRWLDEEQFDKIHFSRPGLRLSKLLFTTQEKAKNVAVLFLA